MPHVELGEGLLRIGGYQRFDLRKRPPRILNRRRPKLALAEPYLASLDRQLSVGDIGCSAGLNGLTLLLMGFDSVTFIDHDPDYLAVVSQALGFLQRDRGNYVEHQKFSDIDKKFGVTLALALVHWLFDSTENYDSLNAVVQHLSEVTESTLIIEWIEPHDPCFSLWPRGVPDSEKYSRELFLHSLSQYFSDVRFLGYTSRSRSLWLAARTKPERRVGSKATYRFQQARWLSRAYRLFAFVGTDFRSLIRHPRRVSARL